MTMSVLQAVNKFRECMKHFDEGDMKSIRRLLRNHSIHLSAYIRMTDEELIQHQSAICNCITTIGIPVANTRNILNDPSYKLMTSVPGTREI